MAEAASVSTKGTHNSPHDSSPLVLAGLDVEKITTLAVISTALVSAAVVAIPLVLPMLGLGEESKEEINKACCVALPRNSGIVSGIDDIIRSIPVVGTHLSTAGGNNILIPAATMISGHLAGNLVSDFEKDHGGKGTVGAIIRTSSMALGAILSLPALLPGIAHTMLFISEWMDPLTGPHTPGATTDISAAIKKIAEGIGATNYCAVQGVIDPTPGKVTELAAAPFTAGAGIASVLGGHAACLLPAALSLAGPTATKAQKVLAERENAMNANLARGV